MLWYIYLFCTLAVAKKCLSEAKLTKILGRYESEEYFSYKSDQLCSEEESNIEEGESDVLSDSGIENYKQQLFVIDQ